jgi:hypothetical protein
MKKIPTKELFAEDNSTVLKQSIFQDWEKRRMTLNAFFVSSRSAI